jgi:hypothetical protein
MVHPDGFCNTLWKEGNIAEMEILLIEFVKKEGCPPRDSPLPQFVNVDITPRPGVDALSGR